MIRAVMKAGFRESNYDTGEVILNYHEGPPNGRPLILIPGQSMFWESYQLVLPGLSKHFRVYAVDIRGHGRSTKTPGKYNFNTIGRDLVSFVKNVVREPAFVSGNSSGGLIAIWLAANLPEMVLGIIPEDPPVFSAEWPRLRDECYVFSVFKLVAGTLGKPGGRDFAEFFNGLEVPVEGSKRIFRLPALIKALIVLYFRFFQAVSPGKPVDLFFAPLELRVFMKSLFMFDPNFSAAFLDGSACADFDHAKALLAVRCPVLLMHADWFRHEKYGLVGAMEDRDVERIRSLVKDLRYLRVPTGHTIHIREPEIFIKELLRFAGRL